ncbi:MAG TPA: LLM class flavin-dependent oxidoreductase [Candidatus Lustribacter sp.]|jgi:alkanesulfonate monooxygenase SsuD/methylene tetrahydromethanopterin reductase-like flavin-dependent oxidoreductase (luciferase family)|nr:LLM class flavin-dependent oxidoreductase [Candidatus Lustribacter sp.]
MYTDNAFKLGLFGANCSSGRAVTMVPERWRASWRDNLALAQMADEAGLDFLLPIGRWKGYGGDTDYQGATFETITWATGLLAQTKRIVVFGTVHAPLFPPIIAAKQIVTADHVGEGRFGLNIVCGWNEGEFEMFGVQPGDHERRYAQGQEWIDALRRIWTEDDFDFDGEIIRLHGVRAKPKPWDATRPVLMNAGSSPEGKAFAIRNCDAFFTTARRASHEEAPFEEAARGVIEAKAQARAQGHEIGVYSVGVVTVRPTQREAEDYARYVDESTDWNAVDSIMEMKGLNERPPEVRAKLRAGYARGMGGLPLTGDPDRIAAALAEIAAAGFNGLAISFVNYLDELPYFRDEVLPRLERLGLRSPVLEGAHR